MSGNDKIYLNALNRLLIGDVARMEKLLQFYGNVEAAFSEYSKTQEIKVEPQQEWEKLEKENIKFITRDEPQFPKLLKEIQNPPYIIYVRGEANLDAFAIAIVGTRKATRYGKEIATTFGRELAQLDITVVSGMVIGIDTAGHQGALEGKGKTIAVLGNGLDQNSIYPWQNLKLAGQILESGGALISEYAPGTPALPHQFLARDRIISGLSKGVIVVEAPQKSGALVTARYAAEQGREVFAVPGDIYAQNSKGTHRLIKEGAKLVETIGDVLEEFGIKHEAEKRKQEKLEGDESVVFALIAQEPLNIEELAQQTKLDTPRLLAALSMLELKTLIKNVGNGRYARS